MANLEDTLIDAGQTPLPFYPCSGCSTLRPPFALDEAMLCSTCHIEDARAAAGPTIEALRDAKKAEITSWRDMRDLGGAPTPLGVMDSDPTSVVKITGAVQMAQIALAAEQPFAIGWTMKDNGTVEHDAPAMIAAGVAVGQFIVANHATSVALKAQADAATSPEELNLIIWPEE